MSYRTAVIVALLSLDDFGHSYVTAEQTLISVLPDGAGNRPCGSFWPLRAAKISPGWKPPKHEIVALFGLFWFLLIKSQNSEIFEKKNQFAKKKFNFFPQFFILTWVGFSFLKICVSLFFPIFAVKLIDHWYLISTVIKMKLSWLVTYIFEIYKSTAFQRGITWAKSLENSWDSDSQLLEVIIKMSPDCANFWYKCF